MEPEQNILPLLERGAHHTPRLGACFMELASYLAGERWSDAPARTDVGLAQLARLVNDLTSDEARPLLAPMIPEVVGLIDLGEEFPEEVALIAAIRALPVASEELAKEITLNAMRIVGDAGDYHVNTRGDWKELARERIENASVYNWAHTRAQRRIAAAREVVVGSSVATNLTMLSARALAESENADEQLHDLLRAGIDWALEVLGRSGEPAPVLTADQWEGIVKSA